MRSSARSRDDADVIRARLRALLAEGQHCHGWVPDDPADPEGPADRGDPAQDAEDGAFRPHDLAADERYERSHPEHRPVAGPDESELPAGLGRHRAPGRTARLDPGRPGAWAMWAAAVLAAAGVVGWTWLGRPAVDQVPTASATVSTAGPAAPTTTPAAEPDANPGVDSPPAVGAPASGTVVVSVVGQVATPGLVTLPAGARVADALAAAGGLLPEADPASVNAAAVLSDGQQIAVGVPGAVAEGDASSAAADGGVLDLNTATAADLDGLPGIGPVLAQRIVDHRTAHGPFRSVDELDDVSGIGPAIFADLAPRVRV